MTTLILGLALWWAAHLFKVLRPAQRARLDARLGKGPARGAMAAAILAALVLMIVGYRQAGFVNVWHPPAFLIHVNNLLMLVAVVFMTAGGIRSGVRTRIRHPQLTAVKTWAVAHLLVNGDLASILLFGGLLAWALVAVIAINRRDGAWERPAPATARGWLILAGVAIGVFAVIATVHNLLGVSPFPGGA